VNLIRSTFEYANYILYYFRTVTNYTKPTSTTTMKACDIESSSEHLTFYIEEDDQSEELNSRPGTSSSHSSSSHQSHLATPSRRSPKRKSLEDVNARFMEAASSFKEMCSNLAHNRKQPTEDELFGQRVVAFIRAFTDKEDKDNAKAGVLKYLADCLSAQFE
jgi:hypothetical protein